MSSTGSFSTSLADVFDDFEQIDDFCLPLPPQNVNKNDALNEVMNKAGMEERIKQIIAQAQSKVNEKVANGTYQIDNYVERYVLPVVLDNRRGRTTSSGFIPEDCLQYERKFGIRVAVVDVKPSTTTSKPSTTTSKPTTWFSNCLCTNPQVRY